ncbi:MAG: methionine synthase, partial [Acidobacteria bacterium]
AGRLLDPARRGELEQALCQERETLSQRKQPQAASPPVTIRRSVDVLESVLEPPDLDRHALARITPDEVWRFLNPSMLLGKHMGLKGRIRQKIEEGDEKAEMLIGLFEELKAECRHGAMQIQGVWQFFPAQSSGNRLALFGKDGQQLEEFDFPRQGDGQGLCLADYVWPEDRPLRDSVCLFAVSAGKGIREMSERYRDQGQFLKSYAIQALAIESAEAAAEWLHSKLRGLWGFPDPPEMTIREKLQSGYRGKRYSFGYPACPALEDQVKLWRLIRPDEIGIELTDGYMMEPEASVSAIVFHHPQAKYFSVSVS